MEQIYNFEGAQPPVLTEKLLRAEQERRKSRFQILWIVLGAAFELFCVGVFASTITGSAPLAAMVLYGYIGLSILGTGTFVICNAMKGGKAI